MSWKHCKACSSALKSLTGGLLVDSHMVQCKQIQKRRQVNHVSAHTFFSEHQPDEIRRCLLQRETRRKHPDSVSHHCSCKKSLLDKTMVACSGGDLFWQLQWAVPELTSQRQLPDPRVHQQVDRDHQGRGGSYKCATLDSVSNTLCSP